jgi:tyrosine-specific transport protein
MTNIKDKSSAFSVSLLVGGTCIGGGMLALPVSTSLVGFFPSLLMITAAWIFMTVTGLLILEVNLWMKKEDAHMVTMASRMLGKTGRLVTWIIYLFVCYASLIAYTAAGGAITASFFSAFFGLSVSKFISCGLFAFIFSGVTYLGHRILGRVNTVLFMGMVIAYIGLVSFSVSEVDFSLLSQSHWSFKLSVLSLPLLLTSFSYQYIVPSLVPMLERNVKKLRWSIILGTTIAYCIYLVWQWVILGIVPVEGEYGLSWAYQNGEVATESLRMLVQNPIIATIAVFFSFFALVTSFLGMAMGLFDFLSDGLKIPERGGGYLFLFFLVLIPTLFFAIFYSRVFIVALDTSGGFGDTIINGVMPVLMIWIGRYIYQWKSEWRVPGGKPLLVCVLLFSIFTIGVEVYELCC